MKKWGGHIAGLIGTMLVGGSVAAAIPEEPQGARAFLSRVYSGHARRSPRSETALAAMFEPGLLVLIRKGESGGPDEVGPLDGDPICQCQDDTGFRYRIVSVTGSGAHARAVVENSFVAPARPSASLVTYQLVKTGAGWRIFDIASPDQPSLREWLRVAAATPS